MNGLGKEFTPGKARKPQSVLCSTHTDESDYYLIILVPKNQSISLIRLANPIRYDTIVEINVGVGCR